MANKHIEIEIKLPLNNPVELKEFLNNNAELVSKDIYQKDSYYVPSHRDFLAFENPFEWLRLRKSPKGMFITYKHYFPENSPTNDYCDEFETKIDNLEAMEKMFNALDFKEIIFVEKIRSTWNYKDVEIVIDDVTDIGTFIEIETKGKFEDPKDGKPYLFEILKELNADVGEEDQTGYPFILLEKKGYEFKSN